MKKIILTATMALCTVGLFAQTSGSASSGMSSKKGEMYLPEAGDWAISFDASPFLTYLGSFLTSSSGLNNAPTAQFLNSNKTIMGKYFVDENTAYRGIIRLGFGSSGQDAYVLQSYYTGPAVVPPPTVKDHMSISNHNIGIGGGMEKRKGKTRLQGYYGGELMFWISGSTDKFTYGNAYSNSADAFATNLNWYDFTGYTGAPGATKGFGAGAYGGRPVEIDNQSTFGINLLGFIGFEYFFMPKISVGAEYTWGLGFTSIGAQTYKVEQLNAAGNATQTSSYIAVGKSSVFNFDNGVNTGFGPGSGFLYINFHF